MLNIYQIMSFHHLIKQIITEFTKIKTEPKTNNIYLEFQNLLYVGNNVVNPNTNFKK